MSKTITAQVTRATPRVSRKNAPKTTPPETTTTETTTDPTILTTEQHNAQVLERETAPAQDATPAPLAPIAYYIAEGIRGACAGSGASLFAHTAVFLERTGMLAGAIVPGAFARLVMGPRAVKWHTGKGNMVSTPTGLKLTPAGVSAFTSRKVDAELKAGFEVVLTEGKTDERAGPKNPAFIHPVKPTTTTTTTEAPKA